jgi:methyltransferase (TIGR00027 family)
MQARQSSRTAEYMAFFRALESIRPAGQRLIFDPFAASFLGSGLRRAIRLAKFPGLQRLVEKYADWRLPGARTSAIARTRLIDEAWNRAVGEGIGQIVILGAGYDCRAYRLGGADGLVVFEVDHPSTHALKRECLERMLPEMPQNVRFTAIDFNRESLSDALARSGFDHTKRALLLWEGVTNYLTEEAVDAVLRYAGTSARGSLVVFTYVHRGVLDGSVEFFGGEKIRRDVAALHEPWTFGFDPAELRDYLSARNLDLEYDAGAREYRNECFGQRSAGMKGYDFYHLAMAHVAK